MKKTPTHKILLAIVAATAFIAGSKPISAQKMTYPSSKKTDVVFEYSGHKVPDTYNWLEADGSADVQKWITDQNKFTQNYISTVPYRDRIAARLKQIWDYPKYSAPSKKG